MSFVIGNEVTVTTELQPLVTGNSTTPVALHLSYAFYGKLLREDGFFLTIFICLPPLLSDDVTLVSRSFLDISWF